MGDVFLAAGRGSIVNSFTLVINSVAWPRTSIFILIHFHLDASVHTLKRVIHLEAGDERAMFTETGKILCNVPHYRI